MLVSSVHRPRAVIAVPQLFCVFVHQKNSDTLPVNPHSHLAWLSLSQTTRPPIRKRPSGTFLTATVKLWVVPHFGQRSGGVAHSSPLNARSSMASSSAEVSACRRLIAFTSKRWWVRLHEKGGKRHEMPAHHGGCGRDRSNIAGEGVFLATLLYCVLYSLLHSHEVPARQG
jgi:hypothetical protein